MKHTTKVLASLGGGLAVLALVVYFAASTMDTTITTSDQNLAQGWASVLLVVAAIAALPALVVAAVRLDRSTPHEDIRNVD